MKIGIDIDGVISDFVTTFRKVVKDKYGIEFAYEDITQHDLYKVLGIDKDEAKQLIYETFDHDLGFQAGAIEGIKELHKHHEIVLVTARTVKKRELTERWLSKHAIQYHKLVFLEEGSKHSLENEGFDAIIDDHLEEIVNWMGKIPLVLVFNHPWNKSVNIKNNFERVYDWSGILERLDRHANSRG